MNEAWDPWGWSKFINWLSDTAIIKAGHARRLIINDILRVRTYVVFLYV